MPIEPGQRIRITPKRHAQWNTATRIAITGQLATVDDVRLAGCPKMLQALVTLDTPATPDHPTYSAIVGVWLELDEMETI